MSRIYRRVIRIGEKSVGITIPRQWLDYLGISIGDLVEVTLSGNIILVRPITQGGELNDVSLNVGSSVEEIIRVIIAGYIEGYDNIELIGDKDSIRKAYYHVEDKLPGSIMLERDGAALLKVAVSETNVNLYNVLSSMASLVNTMFLKLLNYLETDNESFLKEVLELDEQVDKLYFLALRTIKKASFKDSKTAIDDAIIIKNLEHAADALDRLSNAYLRAPLKKCRREVADKLRAVRNYFMNAIKSYLTSSIELALRVILEREKMLNSIMELMSVGCMEQAELLAATIHEGQLIVALANDIAEATFSKHVRSIAKPAKTAPPSISEE